MNEQNTKYLFDNFPNLYANREDKENSLMCYGFSCGDGWFEIIKDLSEKLEKEVKEVVICNGHYAVQVKEKFGGLCFYMHCRTDKMTTMIGEAQVKACSTCEWCGKTGKHDSLRDKKDKYSWIRTLCDSCAKKRDKGFRPWAAQGI